MYSWQTFRRQSIRYLSSDRCIDAMLDAGRCRWITRALSSRFGANIAPTRAEVNITVRLVEVDIAYTTKSLWQERDRPAVEASSGIEESPAKSLGNGRSSVANAELRVDAQQVRLHRRLAEVKLHASGSVRRTVGDKGKHLEFARSE